MRRREEMNKATSKKGGARRRWLREVEAAGARLAAEQVSQGVLPPPSPMWRAPAPLCLSPSWETLCGGWAARAVVVG